MLNLSLLRELNSRYPESHIPLLQEQLADWAKTKPLQGVRILHNLAISWETMLKLEPLLLAGADLTLTKCDLLTLPYQAEIDAKIREIGIRYIPDYKDLAGEFDIGMDCAGRFLYMPNVRFTKGIIELTQTGTERYRQSTLAASVVSVDDAVLKNFECLYGTGESFVRAMLQLTGQDCKGKHFVLFGYGKVGQGMVKCLQKAGATVGIFDPDLAKQKMAAEKGCEVYTGQADLKTAAAKAFCIATATGKAGIVGNYLRPTDCEHAYLASMGVDAEFGPQFAASSKLLCNDSPINFSLQHPTLMRYLDPIFYAHNAVCLAILAGQYASGYNALNPNFDAATIHLWKAAYKEDISDIEVLLLATV